MGEDPLGPHRATQLEEKDIEEVRGHVERWEQADRHAPDSLFDDDP